MFSQITLFAPFLVLEKMITLGILFRLLTPIQILDMQKAGKRTLYFGFKIVIHEVTYCYLCTPC